jgi:hypothetical protein
MKFSMPAKAGQHTRKGSLQIYASNVKRKWHFSASSLHKDFPRKGSAYHAPI